MNLADLGHTYPRPAAPEMIVVRGDDDDFFGEARIATGKDANDIAQLERRAGAHRRE